MQLSSTRPTSPLRERLGSAALALALVPTAAAAVDAPAASEPSNQFDVTTLFYGEQNRVSVFEPVVRATRLFGGGSSLFGQIGLDVITGASPSGALPSGSVQTRTSASGRVRTVAAGEIPTVSFSDQRAGVDGAWQTPLGRYLTANLGAHASREKDYQSLGGSGTLAVQFLNRTLTLNLGGSFNDDSVFPVGGTPPGLSDGSVVSHADNSKRVTEGLLGVSRVMTRRWILALDGTRTLEHGYLTEPYKVLSLMDPVTGVPVGQLTENRPSDRTRSALVLSSVVHLTEDVLYSSYRYYTDSWGVTSGTLDFRYRHDFDEGGQYVEPHLRLYRQSKADFFTIGLVEGAPLPAFATADYRLGDLTTLTLGTTVAFSFADFDGLWTLRAEYIGQFGDGSPPEAIGVQRRFDLAPAINTFTLVLGYSFHG